MSGALAQTGTIHARDEQQLRHHAPYQPRAGIRHREGRLVPEPGWLPFRASLGERQTRRRGMEGRFVALVPRFARGAWLSDSERRPFLPVPRGAPTWFQLPI